VKKIKSENSELKRENGELFDDNVRLTLEVNRLSDQLELVSRQLVEMEGHASVIKDLTDRIDTTLNRKGSSATKKTIA
jgi:regulator of replication initiation timing